MKIKIHPDKCPKDHSCPAAAQCPAGALTQKDGKSLPQIDTGKCAQCLMCVSLCPNGAITFEE